ncbi:phage tail protein [Streptomyces sp. ISL-98]|uniref:phage tail protein n=1 Tax=Streptomyces sp. ISL-98 TaxID=2819192 RepID=UPI001BED07B6|nr:phage tail protein [Streptomyces sp. ISL-98]MBT2508799.1 phage tail protein [Streptomyces sp. ISL-98]
MGNDIQISVRVSNDTGAGLAAANTSLNGLKDNAQRAGHALNGLVRSSTAAATSLATLSSRADSAERALVRLRGAAGDIRVTASIDDRIAPSVTAIKNALRDLKRESPVRLDVAFDGQSAQITAAAAAMQDLRGDANGAGTALTALSTRAAAAATALNSLEQQAEEASDALRTLRRRAVAASEAMADLRDRVAAVSLALRAFNVRAQTADGRLDSLATRTRTLRGDMDDLDGSLLRVGGRMGALRGNLGSVGSSSGGAGNGMQSLKTAAIALASALIPIAAATVPIAAGLGAAGIAVAAFGLAIGQQVAAISEAAAAEKKYKDAVKEHGQGSAEAAKAARQVQVALADMPESTQQAAAGLSLMKDQYKAWSDSLADSTMPVATKSFAAFGALLPKLSPLVRGASSELDRLMTVMAGGIESDGFARFMDSFSGFAEGALSKATDGLISFSRAMAGGAGHSEFTEFMAYAREVGPAVGETLGNLAKALIHLVASASDLGVSMLGIVNAFAQVVNAIPTDLIATFLQLAIAFKVAKLAIAGFVALQAGLAAFGAAITAMGTAAIGASGGLATLTAAFAALSVGAKAALLATGIGILVVALTSLAQMGRSAPPDVEKLTSSLGKLARSGKVSGEAARVYGKDFAELEKSLRTLARPSNLDKTQQAITSFFGMDSTPVKESKEAIDGIDKALAGMVKGGNAEMAEAALKRVSKSFTSLTEGELRTELDDYKSALADMAFEAQLAAEAQGLFGQQALAVQEKLSAQKSSADGLAQSINALSNAYLMARGGIRGMEAAMDAADAAFKKNGKTLDETTEKGRGNAQALDDIAASTMKAVESARANGASWNKVNGIYDRGRAKILALTRGVTDSEAAAKRLADQILRTPDKTARLKGNMQDLQAKLNSAKGQLRKVPDSRKAQVRADIADLKRKIAQARYELSRIDGSSATATITTRYVVVGDGSAARRAGSHGSQLREANGSVTDYYAQGGIRHFANGSENHVAQIAPAGSMRVWAEPETGGEAYIPLSESKRPRSLAILEEVADRFGVGLETFAKGGLTKAQKAAKARRERAAAQAKAEREARSGAQGDLTISHFGKMAGYQRSEIRSGLAKPDSLGALVNSLNQWRGIIMKATHGRTERNLLRQLDATGRALLKQEKALSRVTDQLDKAKSKLADLKNAASQLASSVKSNILGSANITKGASGEGRVTTASIMGGLTGSRDKATAFAKALKDLQKKGLSKDLLAQVAEAGIDGGGLETASALLGSSKSEIASMNQLQAQITKAASAAGKVTADAVYGAQIKAQAKVVGALKSVQEKLTKSMDRLAKAMEKVIEKAFSKKAAGGIVGAAASGGVRGGLTLTGEEGPEIVRLPVGSRVYPTGQSKRMAWESMLTTGKHAAARPAAAPTAVGVQQPIVVHQVITLDGKVVARQIFDPMRDEVLRRTGGDVQKALGRN